MKILLFGKNGQVASKLRYTLLPLGDVICISSQDVDFTDHSKLAQCIRHHAPQCVVNASAYTNVDKAEDEPDLAFAINAEAVKILAEEALKLKALLVHYSTDYVFDGTKEDLYTEKDVYSAIGVYGKSKALGEEYIVHSGCDSLILRTSWVYSNTGNNFARTILKFAKERNSLRVVNDQIGAPTSAQLIADVTSLMIYETITTEAYGTYNLTARGHTTWYDFAKALLFYAEAIGVELKCKHNDIVAIPTSEYPMKAKRPMNSRLDLSKIEQTFGLKMPHWDCYVSPVVDDLYARHIL